MLYLEAASAEANSCIQGIMGAVLKPGVICNEK